MPLERDRISAIPMMPMEPAKAVRIVRVFFVIRLLRLRPSAVKNDMDVRRLPDSGCTGGSAASSYGALSARMLPSSSRTVRVA